MASITILQEHRMTLDEFQSLRQANMVVRARHSLTDFLMDLKPYTHTEVEWKPTNKSVRIARSGIFKAWKRGSNPLQFRKNGQLQALVTENRLFVCWFPQEQQAIGD